MVEEVTITIIIPVFNSEKSINKLITDILVDKKQLQSSKLEVKVLIIDDGSSDKTVQIIREIERDNIDTVSILENSHGGVSKARNSGINKCTSDYMLFFDSDDEWKSGFLKKLYNELVKLEFPQVIFFNAPNTRKYTDSKNDKIDLLNTLGDTSNQIPSFYPGSGVIGKMYQTRFIKEQSILFNTDLRVGEDTLFNVVAILASSFVGTSTVSVLKYNGEHSIAKVMDDNFATERKLNRELFKSIIQKNPYSNSSGFNLDDEFSIIFLRYCLNGFTFLVDRYLYGKSPMNKRKELNKILNIKEYKFCLKNYPKIKKKVSIPIHSRIIILFVRKHFPLGAFIFIYCNNSRKRFLEKI
jgi:glycosyltransferase involved in cell wall biosynthesis